VPERDTVLRTARRWGVELGQVIEYSIPHLQAYQRFSGEAVLPNSLCCSQYMINLPVFASLGMDQRAGIVREIRKLTT
jgi:dTDP-4-amino-4,6-dideoxygalactose transaminase